MSVPSWKYSDGYPRVVSSSRTVRPIQRTCCALSTQSSSSCSCCPSWLPLAPQSSSSACRQSPSWLSSSLARPSCHPSPQVPCSSSRPPSQSLSPWRSESTRTTCTAVSRTVKWIVPAGLRPVFAARSKYGSPNPRRCGSEIELRWTEASAFMWTWTVCFVPSSHIHTNARSSVPGSLAVAANSTGAPRPLSTRCRTRLFSVIVLTHPAGFCTLKLPEKTVVPWPGLAFRQGSTITQNGLDPMVFPDRGVNCTVELNVCFDSTSSRASVHFAWLFGLPGVLVTWTLALWTPSVKNFSTTEPHSLPATRRQTFDARYAWTEDVAIVGSSLKISTGTKVWETVVSRPEIAVGSFAAAFQD